MMTATQPDFDLIIDAFYLLSVVFFIFGLKRLSNPVTARSGNLLASAGMLLAMVVTLLDQSIVNFPLILAGILVGSSIGALISRLIKMTAMPQLRKSPKVNRELWQRKCCQGPQYAAMNTERQRVVTVQHLV